MYALLSYSGWAQFFIWWQKILIAVLLIDSMVDCFFEGTFLGFG